MTFMPKVAVFLASGYPEQLSSIAVLTPPPLIRIAGRSLLKRALDRFMEEGVEKVIVVMNKNARKIKQRLSHYEHEVEIIYLYEDEPKGTLGSLKDALEHVGDEPFWVVNTDILWLYSKESSLKRLCRLWKADKMDMMLLMYESAEAWGNVGFGDFYMDALYRLSHKAERQVSPWVYTGIQLVKPECIQSMPDAPDIETAWDILIEQERLYGVLHDGEWFHVDDAYSLSTTETYMTTRYAYMPRRF